MRVGVNTARDDVLPTGIDHGGILRYVKVLTNCRDLAVNNENISGAGLLTVDHVASFDQNNSSVLREERSGRHGVHGVLHEDWLSHRFAWSRGG